MSDIRVPARPPWLEEYYAKLECVPKPPQCQKCGGKMRGPTWDDVHDVLDWVCPCGWETSTPAYDSLLKKLESGR